MTNRYTMNTHNTRNDGTMQDSTMNENTPYTVDTVKKPAQKHTADSTNEGTTAVVSATQSTTSDSAATSSENIATSSDHSDTPADTTPDSVFLDEYGNSVLETKIDPSIYLFYPSPHFANAIALQAVKCGYTTQSPVARTNEWRAVSHIYYDLFHIGHVPAYFLDKNDNKVYFLDHAMHKMAEAEGFRKLIDVPRVLQLFPHDHISREFYYHPDTNKPLSIEDVKRFIAKIKDMYDNDLPSDIKYYTDVRGGAQQVTMQFLPVNTFAPRGFQEDFIQQSATYFLEGLKFDTTDYTKRQHKVQDHLTKNKQNRVLFHKDGERNFLLSAPTRSGKSFMSAKTAKKVMQRLQKLGKQQNVVLVVSGIADVGIEWQETFQSHVEFNQQDKDGNGKSTFKFVTRDMLIDDGEKALEDAYKSGAENVVVFLTLQDLSGSFNKSKNPHFIAHDFLKPREDGSSPVDFLIVDEAHFAAFNQFGEYRSMIARSDYEKRNEAQGENAADEPLSEEEFREAAEEFQQIQPSVGTLYVSATPYNELIGGDTFSVYRGNMKIISKRDVLREAEQWQRENPFKREWDSPYFGLPTQHYFGVDTGEMLHKLLEVDKNTGRFVQYDAAHSMIWNFFGYKFEDEYRYPAIVTDPEYVKAGLGDHIVLTVASCAEADAVENSLNMLATVQEDFQRKVINASSEQSSHFYRGKAAYDIKREIEYAESQGVKTVVITVDRLTTGVTVKEWDTVVFWRTMSSAQKFDQMSGRNGTPYTVSMKDAYGDTIKRCEKPNVAVISYAPEQMLEVIHETALTIAQVKRDENASQQSLPDMLDEELSVTPTYILSGGEYMVRVDATNIMKEIYNVHENMGTREAANNVLVNTTGISDDTDLLNQILQLDASDKKLSLKTNAFETPEYVDGVCERHGCDEATVSSVVSKFDNRFCEVHLLSKRDIDDKEKAARGESIDASQRDIPSSKEVEKKAAEDVKSIDARVRNLVSVVLMFAALSNNDEYSLNDVIASIEDTNNTAGARIARHLGLNVELLKDVRGANTFNHTLDAEIYKINQKLRGAESYASIDQVWHDVRIVVNSFGKLSPNEIPTPDKAARILVEKAGLTTELWEQLATLVNTEDNADIIEQGVDQGTGIVEQHIENGENTANGDVGQNGENTTDSENTINSDNNTAISAENATNTDNNTVSNDVSNTVETVNIADVEALSMTIAENGKLRFIDNGCKSAVIFVEIARRAEAAGIPLNMLEFYAVPTSPATYELIRKVFELLGWNVDNILFIEGLEALDMNRLLELTVEQNDGCQRNEGVDCPFHDWTPIDERREYGIEDVDIPKNRKQFKNNKGDYTARAFEAAFEHIFDSIIDKDLQVAARELWGKMKPTVKKFDYAISNPPYQLPTGQNTSTDIFQVFQKIASNITYRTTMVYPAMWQKDISKSDSFLGRFLLENGLYTSDDYMGGDLFDDAIERDYPITVVVCKDGYKGEVFSNGEYLPRELDYWADLKTLSIFAKTSAKTKNIPEVRSSTNISNLHDSGVPYRDLPDSIHNVPIFAKALPGKGGRAEWYYIPEKYAIKHATEYNEWKNNYSVVIQSAPIGRLGIWKGRIEKQGKLSARVLDKGTVSGTTYYVIGSFATLEEAENYASYLNTTLVLLLASLYIKKDGFGKTVPCLGNYTDNNPVFAPDSDLPSDHEYKGLSLDERLYKLFNLSEDEIKIIEQSR